MIPSHNLDFCWHSVVLPRVGVAPYVWGGSFAEHDRRAGTDCTGAVSAVLGALRFGDGMPWRRQFYTGNFMGASPGDRGPFDGIDITEPLVCIADPNDAPSDSPMIIACSETHMVCEVEGTPIEMGSVATGFTVGEDATRVDDGQFTKWFYLPGPIGETMRGLDYSAARPAGEAIADEGYEFVVRYLSDGGDELPGKLLTSGEANDLRDNDISIAGNWETTADMMLGGYDQGKADAKKAMRKQRDLGGGADRPIYFSADFDATPEQQEPINKYLDGAADAIGRDQVGLYAGYHVIRRAFDDEKITYGWQTEAWSGGNVDDRIHIMQLNSESFVDVDGVQCDVNEARATDFGQWDYDESDDDENSDDDDDDGGDGVEPPADMETMVRQIWGALFNPVKSFSRYSDGSRWPTKDFILFMDARTHEHEVERAALRGHKPSRELVEQATDDDDDVARTVHDRIKKNN